MIQTEKLSSHKTSSSCLQNIPNRKYQIHLKSNNGSICVLLVNRDSPQADPVVVSVPPAESAQKTTNKDAITNNTKVNEKEKEKEKAHSKDVTDVPMVQETAGKYLESSKPVFNGGDVFQTSLRIGSKFLNHC